LDDSSIFPASARPAQSDNRPILRHLEAQSSFVRLPKFIMIDPAKFQLVPAAKKKNPAAPDPGASPFRVVVDPQMRAQLRRALIDLIDNHDEALAAHFADGKLNLESYKEYLEVFARSLHETMGSREGVSFLLRAVGFDVSPEQVNLRPELRWKYRPQA
jgi:hypothetical protein